VGIPTAWSLNLGARALGSILKRSHDVDPAEVRNIVVAKLLGLGSIVRATPLLRGLKRAFPSAKLYFVTTAANRPLIERLASVDQGLYLDDAHPGQFTLDTLSALHTLVRERVDLYFDLEVYSAASSVLSVCSLARNRFGLYRHSARFKRGLFTHLLYFNVTMPIGDIYLQMLRMTGASGEFSKELEPVRIEPEERATLQSKLRALGVAPQRGYVVVNPNASDLLLERRWPAAHFGRFLELLVAQGECPILVGAPSERAYVETVLEQVKPELRASVVNAAGRLSLGELFALIEGARCVVTNDTGPMHLSFALGRPTVCLFGPGSPEHYGLIRDDVRVLYKGIFCSPCIYETDTPPCSGNNICMKLIEPEEVLEATLSLLGRAPRHDRNDGRRLPICDERGFPLGMLSRP
jgi:ADP-heptose:LPS heptosyltransferase